MVNAWWLVGGGVVALWLMIWTSNMAYRQGIWDGAFNHFLPRVRREMLLYDKFRAEEIFAAEKDELVEPDE